MNDLRERAEFWGVDPTPLVEAVESAARGRSYWQGQKPLIASALSRIVSADIRKRGPRATS